jgi:uncharacterized protein
VSVESLAAPRPRGTSREAGLSRVLAVGLIGGATSGLLGVGGGIAMVPLLTLWLGRSQRDAHALSLAAIIPVSVAGLGVFAAEDRVHWPPAIALAAGAIVGARIGARALVGANDAVLSIFFGIFLVSVALVLVLVK